MSTSHQRKRLRERNQHDIDYNAEQEGIAIAGSLKTHTIDFGKNLRHCYYVDGDRFPTGQKHRRGGVGMSHVDRIPKHRHKQKSKHYDLRSMAIHERFENPKTRDLYGKKLYKLINERNAKRLADYKAGKARERVGG